MKPLNCLFFRIKKLYNSSIRNRIIVYFSLLTVTFIVFFGIFSYNKSSAILVSEIINYTNKVVDQTVLNVDTYFEDIKYTAVFISTNSTVLNTLTFSDSTDWKERYGAQVIEDFIIVE